MVKPQVIPTAPRPSTEPEERVDLEATIRELGRAFAPDPVAAKKAWFEIEKDAGRAMGLLKQLLCDDDGPDVVKKAILDALSEETKK